MKRTLLTGLSIVVAAVIGAHMMYVELDPMAFAELRSPTRRSLPTPVDRPAEIIAPSAPKTSRYVKVPRLVYVYEAIQVADSETDQRSMEYSDLMQQKAERMSDEELDKALEDVKAELDAQNKAADSELQKAIDILERLIEESGGTPAAERAQLVIPVLKGQTPTPPASHELTPAGAYTPSQPIESVPTY